MASSKTNGYHHANSNGVHESYAPPPPPPPPIAICGMAMRLPGGIDHESKFWDLLINKKDARGPVPKNRYKGHGKAGFLETNQGYFLNEDLDLSEMDAGFFSMSKDEADQLDPHHRLLLEVVYESFESAGETGWRGRDIGCYVGFSAEDWNDLQAKDPQDFPLHRMTGSFDFALANRISYEYDLRGAQLSFVTKAACCSSALSFHLACEAIVSGQCSSAVVCGANLVITPVMTVALFDAGALSADVSCKPFDASANGYARADAINAVYIKPLDAAIRDGNPIRAVIRSTATNFDGRTAGISNPSTAAQEALMRKVYRKAHLDVAETAFVECHGTGTAAGDPIEAAAVANVWGKNGGILMGSVKGNVGHAEAGSGISSIIKAVLSLEKKTIVPNIKFNTPNPKIPWKSASLSVPTEQMPWPEGKAERISVNNFGFGGANCHIIIDSAESYLRPHLRSTITHGNSERANGVSAANGTAHSNFANGLKPDQGHNGSNGGHVANPSLLVFSANHEESLAEAIKKVEEFYSEQQPSLKDLAFTLGVRRERLPYRAFAVTDGSAPPDVTIGKTKVAAGGVKPVFVFTGQGAQWPGMGKELMLAYPSFLSDIRAMDKWLAEFHPPLESSMEEELLKPAAASRIDKPSFAHTTNTAIQLALVNLVRAWGVQPSAVLGHSGGDVAAAYAAGVYTMKEAITISHCRGQALTIRGQLGGMAAIGLHADEVKKYLPDRLAIACINSGSSVTISGDVGPLDQFVETLKKDRPEVFARKLRVDRAYHSNHMKSVGETYLELLQGQLAPKAPKVPYYSTVKDRLITDPGELGASYWVQNLVSPVLFHTAVKGVLALPELGSCPHIEIGPHSALGGPLRQIYKEVDAKSHYYSLLTRNMDARESLLKAVGQMFCDGIDLDFTVINPGGTALSGLPNYSWHREGGFWHESRVMKSWRFKTFPHHDLLGSRVAEASDLEPVWRNLIHPDTVPAWIRDHVIKSKIVFPAAAFIAMVGEAAFQLSGETDYTIRNVTIDNGSPLIVRDAGDFEVLTSLKPYRLTTTVDSVWYDFSIVSNGSTGWAKHCHGQVRFGPGTPSSQASRIIPSQTRSVSAMRWYKAWRSLGLEFGPSFRGLQDFNAGIGKNTASALIVEGLTNSNSDQLHPTSMTMMFRAIDAALCHGQTRELHSVYQPKYISELYVGSGGGRSTDVIVEALHSPGNVVIGSGYGFSASGKLATYFKDVTMEVMVDVESDENGGGESHGAVKLEWKPDIDFVDPNTLFRQRIKMEPVIATIEKLFYLCVIENQAELQTHTAPEGHLRKFRDWIDQTVEFARQNRSRVVARTSELYNLTTTARRAMIEEIMQETQDTPNKAVTRVIHAIYETTVGVMDGRIDALELLFRDNILTDFYNYFNWIDSGDFIQLLGHENPRLRVLEVGAGTGSSTQNILKNLKNSAGQRLYSTYFYTDVSAGFFGKARERFNGFEGIEYRTFDVTRTPGEQGIDEGSFDLVIAGNVLHATPVLKDTLTNVRRLLCPNGRLLLFEMCPESKFIDYTMGALPGWWLGEADGRPTQPWVLPERWDKELRQAGFDGLESVCYDQEPPFQQNAAMTARASVDFNVEHVPQTPPKRVTILAPPNAGDSTSTIALIDYLQGEGYEVVRRSLEQESTALPPNQDVIFTYDLESAFVQDMKESEFRGLVDFVCSLDTNQSLLWVTHACQIEPTDPGYGLVNGLARTIRSELNLSFGVLELDSLDDRAWDATLRVFTKLRSQHNDRQSGDVDPDYEFALRDGVVHVSRFADVSVTDSLTRVETESSLRSLQISKRGAVDTLFWSASAPQGSQLEPTDVEVDVRVVGMNNRDMYVAMGIVDGDDFGYECAGVVRGAGSEVAGLEIGDRVMVLSEGALCSRLRTSHHRCVKIPEGLSFEQAATMPTIYGTVVHGLLRVGHLKRGQTILVQAAAQPAGIAALHICKAIGAEVYATTDSPDKTDFIVETFGIPRPRIFSSADESFLAGILHATDGRGVDVVLNSLSGELLHTSWRCVAEGGVMVELGKRDVNGRGMLSMDMFDDNRGFYGVDIVRLCRNRPLEASNLLHTIVEMYEADEVKPFEPIVTFNASDVKAAFQFLQKRNHDGKVAIRMPEDVQSLPGAAVVGQKQLFRAEVSYLLVGGLGGLGQAVATWMVERGARNLVFFSRSAANREMYAPFLEELGTLGCSVQTFSGDVTRLEDVKRVVGTTTKPIAGVMQMSLVLRDETFGKMSMDEWNGAVMPKVKGTWNLHEALSGHELDFFIMYSSICGLAGQFGQANYAAANTFLDAFAQYRRSLGLPASVMDIGVMEDVGSLTSTNPGVLEPLRASAYWMLHERELLHGLEVMIPRGQPRISEIQQNNSTNITHGYTSGGQLGLGVRATLPFSDPRNRVIWRRDRRMAAYHNSDGAAADGDGESAARKSSLTQFLATVANNPAILSDDGTAAHTLAHEIGRHVYEILGIEEKAATQQEDVDFVTLGVDSLIMIELRNWLRQRLGVEMAVPEIVEASTIARLGQLATARLKDKYDAALKTVST